MVLRIRKISLPMEGEIRVNKRYSLFPTWVENKLIWLQNYYSLDKWSENWTYEAGIGIGTGTYYWHTIRTFLNRNIDGKKERRN